MAGVFSEFVTYEMKTSFIKIYSYEKKQIVGAVSNPYFEQDVYFENLTQLLLIIDSLQNDLNYPQKSLESRTFDKKPTGNFEFLQTLEPEKKNGVMATFTLKLLFRQNASWQGLLTWIDEKKEASFRSALEMIFMIDSVLESILKQ